MTVERKTKAIAAAALPGITGLSVGVLALVAEPVVPSIARTTAEVALASTLVSAILLFAILTVRQFRNIAVLLGVNHR